MNKGPAPLLGPVDSSGHYHTTIAHSLGLGKGWKCQETQSYGSHNNHNVVTLHRIIKEEKLGMDSLSP